MEDTSNITIVKKTQQIALLEIGNLFINHGGLNSVQESIYCGVPQIIITSKITERKQIANNVAKKKLGICLDKFDEKKIIIIGGLVFGYDSLKNWQFIKEVPADITDIDGIEKFRKKADYFASINVSDRIETFMKQ